MNVVKCKIEDVENNIYLVKGFTICIGFSHTYLGVYTVLQRPRNTIKLLLHTPTASGNVTVI